MCRTAALVVHEQHEAGANRFFIIQYFSSGGVCCQLAGGSGKICSSVSSHALPLALARGEFGLSRELPSWGWLLGV